MMELAQRCAEICSEMKSWFRDQNYVGIDPYLVDEKAFSARRFPVIGPAIGRVRRLLKPLHPWIPKRVFTSFSPVLMPKALGLILSGNSFLFKIDGNKDFFDEDRHLLQLLIQNRSPGFEHLCWGQPFAWGSSPRYPRNTPAVCATSPIAHGILDYYDATQDQMALTMVEDVARYLVEENGYEDFGNSLCLHYGPTNRNLTYNSNIMAASFLLRLSSITKEERLVSFASKATKFVVEGQNADGSWYYTSPQGNSTLNTMIDNRHTGFILEHLQLAADHLRQEPINQALQRGWSYYRRYLFDGVVPKWSPSQSYPVDIHDVAQGIITSVQVGALSFAASVVEFVLDSMFDGRDAFYYKLYRDGRVNQTIFLRWGQAWMFKALSMFSHSSASTLLPAWDSD